MPHPQKPLINPSCAAKCLSDNLFSRLEDRWETDVSKSDEYAGNQFEAIVVIQTSDLRASVYPDVIIAIYYAFVYPLSPYVIASGGTVVLIYLLTLWKIANEHTYLVKFLNGGLKLCKFLWKMINQMHIRLEITKQGTQSAETFAAVRILAKFSHLKCQ